MMRESGFYWCRQDDDWFVTEWLVISGCWLTPGSNLGHDDDEFDEISLEPIKRGDS